MLQARSLDFFDLAARKLEWNDQRQRLLAGNVANADTPGFRSRDLKPFAASLDALAVPLTETSPGHLSAPDDREFDSVETPSEETSPDGNDVALDRQMRLLAENEQDQSVATSLLRRYVSMTDLALGVAG